MVRELSITGLVQEMFQILIMCGRSSRYLVLFNWVSAIATMPMRLNWYRVNVLNRRLLLICHTLLRRDELYTIKANQNLEEKIIMKCPYCGSERIETEIAWGKVAETGNIGLKYSKGIFLTGVVQMYSDLCLDCKSIVRSYIKEETDKQWSHNPGSLGSR